MTNTNETIADIIAEMRALSNPISDGIIAINGRSIADRLEAAWKRERAAIVEIMVDASQTAFGFEKESKGEGENDGSKQ